MKNQVINFLGDGKKKSELKDFLIKDKKLDTHIADDIIESLEIDGSIYYDVSRKIYTTMPQNFFVVSLDKDKQNKLYFEINNQIYYISHTNNLDYKDTILVKLYPNTFRYIRHIKYNNSKLTFEVSTNNDEVTLIPYNHNIKNINLRTKDKKRVSQGDLIIVKIDPTNTNNNKLIKIIGNKKDPESHIYTIMASYGLHIGFNDETLKEAEERPQEVSLEEIKDRKDLREENSFTIDGETAKDLDDAVSIDVDDYGIFTVKVHISNVPFYVPINSELFKTAFLKTASKYICDKVDPMFPHKLSSGICSLNENVARHTITVEMRFNEQGEKLDSNIYLSTIKSKKKMTYENVNELLTTNNIPEGYSPFIKELFLAQKLSLILTKKRIDQGALIFSEARPKFIFDDEGNLANIIRQNKGPAESIIENFMIEANNSVADYLSNYLCIYRNHEYPTFYEIKKILSNLYNLNLNLDLNQFEEAKSLFKLILKHALPEEDQELALLTIIKCLNRAYYSIYNNEHFGLGIDRYTHFTSPIRRIVDFLIHYILTLILTKKYDKVDKEFLEKLLEDASELATYTEEKIEKVENDIHQLMIPEYMKNKIGEEFIVTIKSITPNYITIYSPETLIGYMLFPKKTYFNPNNNTLETLKSNKIFKTNHALRVRVKEVDLSNKVVHYEFLENITIKKRNISREYKKKEKHRIKRKKI